MSDCMKCDFGTGECTCGREAAFSQVPAQCDCSPSPFASCEDFSPFDKDGILCVQDGQITDDPDDDRDWIKYHIERRGRGLIYYVERCDFENTASLVYEGRIPDRAFFIALMNNQAVRLPEGWEN